MKHRILALFKDSNEITDDLKKKLLSNYDDIIKIEKNNGKQFTKIIYFSKKVVEDILYDSEEIINFQPDINNNILSRSFLFYLDLLISSVISNDNVIIDYSFSIEYIKNIHEKKYDNIFISKIIIDLIHYYKWLNEPEIQYNEELEKIVEENKIIIEKNINVLNDVNLLLNEDYIINTKIEAIYINIICSLIKHGNFESFKPIDNIMKQLDLENISLTKAMQEEISNLLKENDDINNDEYNEAYKEENYKYVNNINENDAIIVNKIYINDGIQYDNYIINDYKISSSKDLLDMKKVNFNYMLIKYILKDSIYKYQIPYFIKIRRAIQNIIKYELENLSFCELDRDNRERIEYIIMNITNSYYYLKKFLIHFNENSLKKILNRNIKFVNNLNLITNINIQEYKQNVEYFNNNFEYYLIKCFENDIINKVLDEILTKEEYKFIKELIEKGEFSERSHKIEKSFSNSREDYSTSLINNNNSNNNAFIVFNQDNKYLIEDTLRIIRREDNKSLYIKELSNGQFICGGEKYIILYDQLFNCNYKVKKDNDNVYEIKKNTNNNIEVIVCSNNNKNSLFSINNESIPLRQINIENLENEVILFVLRLDINNIICTNEGTYNYENNRLDKIELLSQKYYGGIIIKNNIIALVTKEIINKLDNITIYNLNTKRIDEKYYLKYKIKPTLLAISENNNNALLCACKKYTRQQKNGILLLNIDLSYNNSNSNLIVSEVFYDTLNFDVYCFCAYSIIINKHNTIINQQDIKTKKTRYILVGGFETNIGKGLIKLYKIKYNNNKLKIKYIRDIAFSEGNNSKCIRGFKSPITDMKQSRITGNILITCLDGNSYLLSNLNIKNLR